MSRPGILTRQGNAKLKLQAHKQIVNKCLKGRFRGELPEGNNYHLGNIEKWNGKYCSFQWRKENNSDLEFIPPPDNRIDRNLRLRQPFSF